MLKLSVAIVAFVAGFSTVGFAQGLAREACKADYAKYCSGVTPGGGRIAACLNKQHDQLSEACKTALDARTRQ